MLADDPALTVRLLGIDTPEVRKPNTPVQPCGPQASDRTRALAAPGTTTTTTHERVRTDKIDKSGVVTLRHHGRLHHIGVGRTHAGTYVLLLVQDLEIRIINAATGEILRELTLDPTRDYQPTGRKPGPQKQ